MFWNEIVSLQKELDRIFNRNYSVSTTYGKGIYPAINIFEKDEKIIVKTEVPGLKKEDLNISLENDVLSLSGEMKRDHQDSACYHRKEISYGTFNRSFKLPYKVDPEKTSAKLENGVLTLELEKHEGLKPRTISIQ